jgi:exodeoxyribonuclease VII small subunit
MSAPKPAAGPEPRTKPSFEESVRQLGEIVDKLEQGDLPLEESLGLFERGMQIAKASQAELDRAEKRVEELLAVNEDGTVVTREVPRT